ncbi:MAG: sigma-70 family RNA polymerase sigma factor [Deltaproteobacteria bacterium]|nr:sigma-70 family RNA polymerase sigma factor [Deltaproteobacteria bacterium]
MSDDIDLLSAWRAGERQAGEALFERYFEPVSRFFINKVPDDHEDLIQETFAACAGGRDRLRDDSSFRSYLFGIAYNVLKRYYRRKAGPKQTSSLDSCSANDLSPGPSTLMQEHERESLLLEALRRIPVELQVVLEMHYWERMRSPEIAGALGIPAGTVRTRMLRGRGRLAQLLSGPLAPRDSEDAQEADLDDWARRVRALMEREPAPGGSR